MLEFRYHKKMDGTHNVTLTLVVTATIVNHLMVVILIDDKSSYVCKILSHVKGKSLLAFNDFSSEGMTRRSQMWLSSWFLAKMFTTIFLEVHY